MKSENDKFKYCHNCGNKLYKTNKFCSSCGKAVTEENPDKDEASDSQKQKIISTMSDEKKEQTEVKKSKVTTEKPAFEPQKKTDFRTLKERFTKTKKAKTKSCSMYSLKKVVAISGVTLCAGALFMYGALEVLSTEKTGSITSINKNVTITENGIAESVDKVYDAVIVIENYVNNQVYATGTGFVFKTDDKYGYILTNTHVIDGADEVTGIFTNDNSVKLEIVGYDSYSDVAVLKTDKKNIISVAEIGSSEEGRLGDTVFTVGAPLDYEVYSWSVTRGILSGKDRLVEVSLSNSNTSDYVMEVLQTDAAINSGNSGGPLCNSNGEVIGITNMKLASSSIEGMGFAIPIETAIEYAEDFIDGKTISRPYLGVSMYDLSSVTNNAFYGNYINTNLTEGVYIVSVENGSPASEAGLTKGDIITKIDDVEISSSAYLRYMLYQHQVGDEIKITYYRNNQEETTKVKLGSANPTT